MKGHRRCKRSVSDLYASEYMRILRATVTYLLSARESTLGAIFGTGMAEAGTVGEVVVRLSLGGNGCLRWTFRPNRS